MAKRRGYARTFGQDLMRGEHVVGGGDSVSRHTASLKGGLTLSITTDPYRVGRDGKPKSTKDRLAQGCPAHVYDVGGEGGTASQTGTSIFDPVLCELAYRWFCPAGGSVLDPFAGGSVRGIVASALGLRYMGIDLRPEQVAANETQAARIVPGNRPRWVVGDSVDVGKIARGRYDLIFSCPPYADLERYSDDPRDLSTMNYAAFKVAYRRIVAASVAMLRNDRFACFVVGDVRDKKGFYRNLVGDTVAAFEDAGARYYNEAILVTMVGSLPIRVGKQFARYRKLGKTHQNVLTFYKGNPKNIPAAFGDVPPGGPPAEPA